VLWQGGGGGHRSPCDPEMGVLCVGAPATLLCGEDRNSALGLGGCDELVQVGSGLDFLDAAGHVFLVDTDEVVRELIEKEMDHLPQAGYAERLERGGLEASRRKDAMDWICKVT
jgi:cyclin D1/2/4, plant